MRASVPLLTASVSLLACLAHARDPGPADREPRAVIEAAIAAHGGADALARLRGVRLTAEGAIERGGETVRFTAEYAIRAPDFQRTIVTVAGEAEGIVRVLAGGKAWQRAGGTTRALAGDELADFRDGVYQNHLRTLRPLVAEKGFDLSPAGEARVSDRPAVGVRVAAAGRPDVLLYFDAGTSLLVKLERRSRGADGREQTLEAFFEDYKAVEGVQYPRAVTTRHDGRPYLRLTVTGVRFEDLGEAEFGQP